MGIKKNNHFSVLRIDSTVHSAKAKGNYDDLALIFRSFVVSIDSAGTKGHLHNATGSYHAIASPVVN